MTHPTLAQAVSDYIESQQQKTPDKWPTKADWLDYVITRMDKVHVASHVPKFTHGDAKGSGALVTSQPSTQAGRYISTDELRHLAIDIITESGAIDSPVARFLNLQNDGQCLIEQLRDGNTSALATLSQDPKQITDWQQGLLKAFDTKCSTHTLIKQTYFPIAQGEYHLLSPLFASSLCHALDQRIQTARFSEGAKAAREARRNDEYCETPITEFPNLAEQHFGGTKPQNISLLNNQRRGRAFLLSCQPPRWQQQFSAPQNDEQFWQQYGVQASVRTTLRQLMAYLVAVQTQDGSAKHKQRRAELIDELVSELHQFAAQVRALSDQKKKTMLSLSLPYHYWLQIPPPSSEADQESTTVATPTEDWAEQIGKDFSRWLNNKLQSKLKHIGDAELQVWSRQIKRELRLLKHDLESGL